MPSHIAITNTSYNREILIYKLNAYGKFQNIKKVELYRNFPVPITQLQ